MVVAIVGASNDRRKFGNKSLRAHRHRGYHVIPVNLDEETIEGLPVVRSVLDIKEDLDRVSVYVPPEVTLDILDDIAKKGTKELFLNPGSESLAVLDKAKRLGLRPILDCSIVDIGESPSSYN